MSSNQIILLPLGFELRGNFGIWDLSNFKAPYSTRLRDPDSFRIQSDWIEYVERSANVAPGTFHKALAGVAFHGQYRNPGAALHGSPSQGPHNSTGRPPSFYTFPTKQSVYDAFNAGYISASEAAYALNYITMTNPGMSSLGYLGATGTSQAISQYAQQTPYLMQPTSGLMLLSNAALSGAPHQPTTLKSEGIRVGEIIAWRAWFIAGTELCSVIADNKPWSAVEPMVGDPAAGYGVHAYKNPHGPVLDRYVTTDSPRMWVIGEVALWGDVIEHENGYRAEFARVHSFVTWSDNTDKATREAVKTKYLVSQPQYKIDDAA